MEELDLLKRLLNYYFIDSSQKPEKEEKENKEKLIEILNELGFDNINSFLIQSILLGEYDAVILKKINIKNNNRYIKYFKKVRKDEIQNLITKYLMYRKNPNFPKEDLLELQILIDLLMRKIGFRGEIDERILWKFRNGEIEIPKKENKRELLKEKLKESYYNREQDPENFQRAFQEYFDPVIDVYNRSKEEMILLTEDTIGKEDKNVLR